MKYSLPTEYYRLIADHIRYHILLFWDPNLEQFVDEDGFAIHNIYEYVPHWALELAKIHRDLHAYFCFQPNFETLVEIFWPDEEEFENWYL